MKHLANLGVKGVCSIGCGTGLLEWLINSSTGRKMTISRFPNMQWLTTTIEGLPVIGYEIDRGWWESRYSPPKFLDNIKCVNSTSVPELNPQFALLFCYFNNMKAFEAYLNSFTGDCVILIGPDRNNKNRYCDPQPFQLSDSKHWSTRAVWRSKCLEAIVVYQRSTCTTWS